MENTPPVLKNISLETNILKDCEGTPVAKHHVLQESRRCSGTNFPILTDENIDVISPVVSTPGRCRAASKVKKTPDVCVDGNNTNGNNLRTISKSEGYDVSLQDDLSNDDENVQSENVIELNFYGLDAIDRACSHLYPESCNPYLILSPARKIWEGGSHPLDYVKVYHNTDVDDKLAPHWHYVTSGISDLYGDERAHSFNGRSDASGYGFELTFRLVKKSEQPPKWPCTLLNDLARYVFKTEVPLREFDHIPWHGSLCQPISTDFSPTGTNKNSDDPDVAPDVQISNADSNITAMLVVEDPQLPKLDTPHGSVTFLQVCGVSEEEVVCARRWRCRPVVDKLLAHPCMGPLLVTDMGRRETIFDLEPGLRELWDLSVAAEGSRLGHVTALVHWETNGDSLPQDSEETVGKSVTSVTLTFDPSAAELLPLVVSERISHGLPFTFSCRTSSPRGEETAEPEDCLFESVQFVPGEQSLSKEGEVSEEELITSTHRLAVYSGRYLEILVLPEKVAELKEKFEKLRHISKDFSSLPLEMRVNIGNMAEGKDGKEGADVFLTVRVTPVWTPASV